MKPAETPAPPYYAVIFTSLMKEPANGYGAMAKEMLTLAHEQPGFLGFETARNSLGISVSYWKDPESIMKWKTRADHLKAQTLGKEQWYEQYTVRVCLVEKEYSFKNPEKQTS